jgi:hypothetical protein
VKNQPTLKNLLSLYSYGKLLGRVVHDEIPLFFKIFICFLFVMAVRNDSRRNL